MLHASKYNLYLKLKYCVNGLISQTKLHFSSHSRPRTVIPQHIIEKGFAAMTIFLIIVSRPTNKINFITIL